MLAFLSVENLAVIKKVELEFGKGVNVITGETGAGKSIIVEAISLLSGRKSGADYIRPNENNLVVEALFLPEENAKKYLKSEFDIECEDELILRREIRKDSRSRAYVQGRSVPVSVLKEIVLRLVDIHSQFSAQSLLKPSYYLALLDSYGEISESVREFSDRYRKYIRLKDRLKELKEAKERTSSELQMYESQLKELSEFEIESLDEEGLKGEFFRLQNASTIKDKISSVLSNLSDEESGALDLILEAKRTLQDAMFFDRRLKDASERMEALSIELKEFISDLDSYYDSLFVDYDRLKELEILIDKIEFLKKKYGFFSVKELVDYRRNIEKKIEELSSFGDDYEVVLKELNVLENRIKDDAQAISGKRKEVAERFSSEVEKHIRSLAMEKASFRVEVSEDKLSATGFDRVDFLVVTNVGQGFSSISKVASGGELSRIMLAMKVVLGEKYGIPTVIFDEIDTGIGGSAVSAVAEKVVDLGKHKQIIMITHLPMLAAISNRHFTVSKYDKDGETFVDVRELDSKEERVKELARMLGSGRITQRVIEHAEELLEGHM